MLTTDFHTCKDKLSISFEQIKGTTCISDWTDSLTTEVMIE